MTRDTDFAYRGVSIPWMSPYGIAIEISGMGFTHLFDEMNQLKMLNRRSIRSDDWEFIGLWRPRFPGWHPITLLVFRSRTAGEQARA